MTEQLGKPYVSDFKIRLGPVVVEGSLLPIRQPVKKISKTYHYVTPDGKPVKQMYVDDDGNLFAQGDLEKAMLTDDKELVLVGKDNIADASAPTLPKNILNLSVHPREQVDDLLFPSDNNAYVLNPETDDPMNIKFYALLMNFLGRTNKAFIGMCNLRGYDGLFRLTLWRDRIVVQKQLYTESLYLHGIVEHEETVDDITFKKGALVLNKLATDFDPDEYVDEKQRSLALMEQAVLDGTLDSATETVKHTASIDIDSILEAFV